MSTITRSEWLNAADQINPELCRIQGMASHAGHQWARHHATPEQLELISRAWWSAKPVDFMDELGKPRTRLVFAACQPGATESQNMPTMPMPLFWLKHLSTSEPSEEQLHFFIVGAIGTKIFDDSQRKEKEEKEYTDRLVAGRPDKLHESSQGELWSIEAEEGHLEIVGEFSNGPRLLFLTFEDAVLYCGEQSAEHGRALRPARLK